MWELNLEERAGTPLHVLAVGAHCDDIEIGCGGTLLALQAARDCRIHWLVLGSTPVRRAEAEASFAAFVAPRSRGSLRIGSLDDGLFPARFAEAKALFEQARAALEPGLVLTHHCADRHQDHRVTGEITWQTFRDHQIWEYEVAKYDGDLATPNVHVALAEAVAERKVELLLAGYASQRQRHWFSAESFRALMRLRGLECRAASGFAEGFHARKLVVGFMAAVRDPAGAGEGGAP